MAYTKTNWVDNETAITADKMNNIENGIKTNEEKMEPIILFNGNIQVTASNYITLNDNINNYRYLEVYFGYPELGIINCNKCDMTYPAIRSTTITYTYNANSAVCQHCFTTLTFINQDVTFSNVGFANFWVGSSTSVNCQQGVTNIYIYKIVGYK